MGRAVSSRFDGDKYTTRSQRKKPEEMERHSMIVLLATDGSEDAALAARAATEISGGIDAELHVVHVQPQFPRYAFPGVTPELYSYVLGRTDQETRDLLDEQVRHIEESGARAPLAAERRAACLRSSPGCCGEPALLCRPRTPTTRGARPTLVASLYGRAPHRRLSHL
jgi:hypothetical protein